MTGWGRRLLVAWLLLLALAPAALAGKGVGLEVRAGAANRVATPPGRVVTAGFRVTLPAGAPAAELIEALELPAGWTAATPPTSFALGPGETRTRLVAVVVPGDAPAGEHVVRYVVRDRARPWTLDADVLRVEVARVDEIAVALADVPELVPAGEVARLGVLVRNEGNTPARVALSAEGDALELLLEAGEVELAPRASARVGLTVATSAAEPRAATRILKVSARTAGADDVSTVAVLTVLPTRTGPDRSVRTVPAVASLHGVEGDGRYAVQPELQAAGPLDGAGKVGAELRLRGPDAAHAGFFGQRDEYRLTLDAPVGEARLGDQTWGLTELVSPYRYGLGAGLAAHPGAFDLAAHHVVDRFDPTRAPETGALAGARMGERARLLASFLQRDTAVPDRMVGLAGDARPLDGTSLSAEYALDLGHVDLAGQAFRIEADTLLWDRLSLAGRKVRAGADFGGYHRDVDLTAATASLPVGRRLTAQASWQRIRENLALMPIDGVADLEETAQARGVLALPRGWSVETALLGARELDLGAAADVDAREGAARVSVGRSTSRWYAHVLSTAGLREDRVAGDVYPMTQVGAYAAVYPAVGHTVRGWATWSNAEAEHGRLLAADESAGAAVSSRLARWLLVEAEGRRTFGVDAATRLDARAEVSLRRGETLSGRVRLEASPDRATSHSALLSVSVPFGVPVGRDRTTATVRGRVFDAEAPGEPGIPGVVVRVGDVVAVSGRDGGWAVTGLAPGTHGVRVERSSLAIGRVVERRLPLHVSVVGGGVAHVDLGVADGAKVGGRVVVVGTSAVSADREAVLGSGDAEGPRALAGVLVELRDGVERLSRLTDAEGRFSFDGVRPGRWTLAVDAAALPTFHYTDQPEQEIVVVAGERASRDVEVKPRVRLIRLFPGSEQRPGPEPVALAVAPEPPRAPRPDPRRRDDYGDGWTERAGDCDDEAPSRHPEAAEVCGDGADDDCDGARDEGCVETARLHWSGEAVVEGGIFLDGRLRVEARTDAGEAVCRVEAELYDDGAELPPEECPGCEWAFSLAMADDVAAGAACEPLGLDGASRGATAWGYAPVYELGERVLFDVIWRWDGAAWRAFTWSGRRGGDSTAGPDGVWFSRGGVGTVEFGR
ncbi:MAG: MopE-related protein [Myxococcota bacterium]